MPFERDGHVTKESIIEHINTELANVLGNLVKRTLSMTNKYFDGIVMNSNIPGDFDKELIEMASTLAQKVSNKMETLHVQEAISEIMEVLRRCNKYVDETTPWALDKDPETRPRLQTVLYNLLESIRIAAIQLRSFLPETSDKILNELNTNQRSFESSKQFGLLESGIVITKEPSVLFARYDIQKTLELLDVEKVVIEHKAEITVDDFDKIELRKGTVLTCQKHPKADKLLVFQVDMGDKVHQIVSGIAESYQPEDLIGKEVLVCVNLKPIKLRGELSEGMILSAEMDGKFQVVEIPNVKNGSAIL